jgi:hypothetical protein
MAQQSFWTVYNSKLNGTPQLLVCMDDVNILDGSIHTLIENTVALVSW